MRGLDLIMTENFWRDLPRPFFILAPMEDVTDVVFRHVVSEAARQMCFFYRVYKHGELLSSRGEPKCAWTFDFYRR